MTTSMEENQKMQLPENAQRELKPGEEYQPLLSPKKNYPEVTLYSVLMGIAMAILFSAAAAYLGLKVGQVFEAAIPIAIIAVGVTGMLGKQGGLSQNVIIQSIGGTSGAVVAGAIFTLPAIYILGLEVNYLQMALSSLLAMFSIVKPRLRAAMSIVARGSTVVTTTMLSPLLLVQVFIVITFAIFILGPF